MIKVEHTRVCSSAQEGIIPDVVPSIGQEAMNS